MNSDLEKIEAILRHIENVYRNCKILGEKFIEAGETDLGRQLIANGLIHDNSKFHGVEWEHLSVNEDDKDLKVAINHHNRTNLHHPEAWAGGIHSMPDVYLAEMACDIKARSSEFGTSIKDWVEQVATEKYDFKVGDKIYKKLMKYVNMLCDQPFKIMKKDS